MKQLPEIQPYRNDRCRHGGATLLEVLLAIVIFAVGMLALASLQSNLTRSSSDANMRTVAANIAEETIEGLRAFEVISTQAGKRAYQDIVDTSATESRGGVDYSVNVDVKDYYFLANRQDVSDDISDAPAGTTVSSFKYAEVTVTWNTGIEFQIDKDTSTDDRLGSGSLVVGSIIPSIPALNNAKVAANDDGALGYPPVNYTPGEKPDIVAINLGNSKFKESTTPEPIVRRKDELMETWFDVITYTKVGDDATFVRREEFVSISCECTLRAEAGDDGRAPTVWNGAEYVEGEILDKPFGESATNQQSQYCDVCCNDHHDADAAPESYRPGESVTGNHAHYSRSNKGVLTPADAGDDYIEACRLVRKDGFFRVAQDFSLQNEIAFPENYLDETAEVNDYSDYVTDAVEDHFSLGTDWSHSLKFEGDATDNRTFLDDTPRQYRSRGIYTDSVNSALSANLTNCFDLDGSPTLSDPDCTITEASSLIEVLPFFDVQLTQLARWTEIVQADPVDASNEEISNKGYSRGKAKLAGSKNGESDVISTIETSNTGLISIQPLRPDADIKYKKADLYVLAGTGGPVGTGDQIVSGTLTNANQTGKAVASVDGTEANCTRPTNTTFSCIVSAFAVDPTIKISNYYYEKQGVAVNLIACASGGLTYVAHANGTSLDTNYTIFTLPKTATASIVITIVQGSSQSACP